MAQRNRHRTRRQRGGGFWGWLKSKITGKPEGYDAVATNGSNSASAAAPNPVPAAAPNPVPAAAPNPVPGENPSVSSSPTPPSRYPNMGGPNRAPNPPDPIMAGGKRRSSRKAHRKASRKASRKAHRKASRKHSRKH